MWKLGSPTVEGIHVIRVVGVRMDSYHIVVCTTLLDGSCELADINTDDLIDTIVYSHYTLELEDDIL